MFACIISECDEVDSNNLTFHTVDYIVKLFLLNSVSDKLIYITGCIGIWYRYMGIGVLSTPLFVVKSCSPSVETHLTPPLLTPPTKAQIDGVCLNDVSILQLRVLNGPKQGI